jgi:hypothetical protein
LQAQKGSSDNQIPMRNPLKFFAFEFTRKSARFEFCELSATIAVDWSICLKPSADHSVVEGIPSPPLPCNLTISS